MRRWLAIGKGALFHGCLLPPHPENEANEALDLSEPLRIERKGYFNPAIRRPVDVEHEACGTELDQAEPEVPDIPVEFRRLDVTNAAIIVLELALNEEVRLHWH
jgi:hypothetical protein